MRGPTGADEIAGSWLWALLLVAALGTAGCPETTQVWLDATPGGCGCPLESDKPICRGDTCYACDADDGVDEDPCAVGGTGRICAQSRCVLCNPETHNGCGDDTPACLVADGGPGCFPCKPGSNYGCDGGVCLAAEGTDGGLGCARCDPTRTEACTAETEGCERNPGCSDEAPWCDADGARCVVCLPGDGAVDTGCAIESPICLADGVSNTCAVCDPADHRGCDRPGVRFCADGGSRCEACTNDDHCDDGVCVQGPMGNVCRACDPSRPEKTCSAELPICDDEEPYECRSCRGDGDCGAHYAPFLCREGRCDLCPCDPGCDGDNCEPCPGFCDPEDCACVDCMLDDHCNPQGAPGAPRVCHERQCKACNPDTGDGCEQGELCLPSLNGGAPSLDQGQEEEPGQGEGAEDAAPTAYECRGCMLHAECGGAQSPRRPFCRFDADSIGRCVETCDCACDNDGAAPISRCQIVGCECVACESDDQCRALGDAGRYCLSGPCVPCQPSDDRTCSGADGGDYCVRQGGGDGGAASVRCAQCQPAAADEPDSCETGVCHPETFTCVPCLSEMDAGCADTVNDGGEPTPQCLGDGVRARCEVCDPDDDAGCGPGEWGGVGQGQCIVGEGGRPRCVECSPATDEGCGGAASQCVLIDGEPRCVRCDLSTVEQPIDAGCRAEARYCVDGLVGPVCAVCSPFEPGSCPDPEAPICAADGQGVFECRACDPATNAGCETDGRVCDPATFDCRSCESHAECGDLACIEQEDDGGRGAIERRCQACVCPCADEGTPISLCYGELGCDCLLCSPDPPGEDEPDRRCPTGVCVGGACLACDDSVVRDGAHLGCPRQRPICSVAENRCLRCIVGGDECQSLEPGRRCVQGACSECDPSNNAGCPHDSLTPVCNAEDEAFFCDACSSHEQCDRGDRIGGNVCAFEDIFDEARPEGPPIYVRGQCASCAVTGCDGHLDGRIICNDQGDCVAPEEE